MKVFETVLLVRNMFSKHKYPTTYTKVLDHRSWALVMQCKGPNHRYTATRPQRGLNLYGRTFRPLHTSQEARLETSCHEPRLNSPSTSTSPVRKVS